MYLCSKSQRGSTDFTHFDNLHRFFSGESDLDLIPQQNKEKVPFLGQTG